MTAGVREQSYPNYQHLYPKVPPQATVRLDTIRLSQLLETLVDMGVHYVNINLRSELEPVEFLGTCGELSKYPSEREGQKAWALLMPCSPDKYGLGRK